MQVKRIAECSILQTFIKLPFVVKTFILSIFEWTFEQVFLYVCFTYLFQTNSDNLGKINCKTEILARLLKN